MREFDAPFPPTGWFQVAWSEDIHPGEVKAMSYFGQDLVCYRGASGAVHVFDAYCPHLGAHLGVGGMVSGEDLICPFHHWRWDCEGLNVDIPYSSRVNRSVRLSSWPVREMAGLVLVWHDAERRQPRWEPPSFAEVTDPSFYPSHPGGRRCWAGRAFQPQVVIENAADVAHFQYIHGAAAPTEISRYEEHGAMVRIVHRFFYGSGGTVGNWAEARMELEAYGLGLLMARFRGKTKEYAHLTAITPVDQQHSDMRATIWVRKDSDAHGGEPEAPLRARTALMGAQWPQAEHDIQVWENMSFVERAPLVPEEARYYRAVRRWCEQFYPRAEGERSAASGPSSDGRPSPPGGQRG